MRILAIDPGHSQSAVVGWDGKEIFGKETLLNEQVIPLLLGSSAYDMLAIEMVTCYGKKVGKDIFETVFWIGRFVQAWSNKYKRIYRKTVAAHLCNSVQANDAKIRAALITRFGMPGTEAIPGLTYGLKTDQWSAFGVAVTCWDKQNERH